MIAVIGPALGWSLVDVLRPDNWFNVLPGKSYQAAKRKQSVKGRKGKKDEPTWDWSTSADAVASYAALISLLGVGQYLGQSPERWHSVVYFGGLAIVSIYIGAHRALTAKNRNYLKLNTGYLAPFFLSASLFGVYLAITYFPNFSFRQVLDAYIYFLVTVAVTANLDGPFKYFLDKLNARLPDGQEVGVKLPSQFIEQDDDSDVEQTQELLHVIVAGIVALGLSQLDSSCLHGQFTVNNAAAVSVAILLMEGVGVRSLKVAALLLVGLLVYDVFWVFASPKVVGANVMATVATSDKLAGPFKLIYPRPAWAQQTLGGYPFSVLGLGDVVLPGLLVALTLRMDAMKHVQGILMPPAARTPKSVAGQDAEKPPPDPQLAATDSEGIMAQRDYFTGSMGGYVVGYGFTIVALQMMDLAQPALLYLVPGVLAAVVGRGLWQEELGQVWEFEDRRKDVRDAAREARQALAEDTK